MQWSQDLACRRPKVERGFTFNHQEKWEDLFVTVLTWLLATHLLVLEWKTGLKMFLEIIGLIGNVFNFCMLLYSP